MSEKLKRAKHTYEAVKARQEAERGSREARQAPSGDGNRQNTIAIVSKPAAIEEAEDVTRAVSSSAALISICNIISRITGFARTWTMGLALGVTLLSSSYQVANNVPNMLYELVVGGMLVTAFLPVYMSVKKKLGTEAGNAYASNLLTIVVVFTGVVAVLCMLFPSAVIWTQTFFSDAGDWETSVFFFQFFAIQIIFYGASSILSGLLNANRDYLWSSIAPVFNNLIVIATFVIYAVIAPENPETALYVIAIGNPLGVFVQMAIQIPALKRNGIRLKPHIDLRDPALKETLTIGIPAVIIMIGSFAVVSAQNAAAAFYTVSGPSILLYARMWFTLPYALLVVPITTTLFTEISDMHSEGDMEGVKRAIVSGTSQIVFFMIPFTFYLILFATPLLTLNNVGEFSTDGVASIASYLSVLALALPFYGVNTYLQKIFSSLRILKMFTVFDLIVVAIQIALTIVPVLLTYFGILEASIETIAFAEAAFFLILDVFLFIYLRVKLGTFGMRQIARACVLALALGLLGTLTGGMLLFALETFVAPIEGAAYIALPYIIICGLVSLLTTFGLAIKFKVKEAAFLTSALSKITKRGGKA